MFYYVYVFQNEKNRGIYIGYTTDIKRRVREHESEKGSEWKLKYCECFSEKKIAQERERKLKQYGGAWRSLKKRIGL